MLELKQQIKQLRVDLLLAAGDVPAQEVLNAAQRLDQAVKWLDIAIPDPQVSE